jgi:DNA polymerase-3 subunit delta
LLHLLRDDFFGEQRLAELRQSLGSADMQSLNLSYLDGPKLTLAELRGSAEALPFFGDRRMIVVRRLFPSGSGRAADDADAPETRRGKAEADRDREFLAYLPRVPDSTILVLYEDAEFKGNHPAVKVVRDAGGDALASAAPSPQALPDWISRRVREKGGRIDGRAVQELIGAGIDDFRQLDQTLDKLVVYADERTIASQDISALVPETRDVTVFALVDAVGGRDRKVALETYRRLLGDEVSPIYLLVMLTRQIRLLLGAHDALANREDLASALKVPPWVAQKIGRQARIFNAERCVQAYRMLAEVDAAIKTGQADETIAVELLLVDLTER